MFALVSKCKRFENSFPLEIENVKSPIRTSETDKMKYDEFEKYIYEYFKQICYYKTSAPAPAEHIIEMTKFSPYSVGKKHITQRRIEIMKKR